MIAERTDKTHKAANGRTRRSVPATVLLVAFLSVLFGLTGMAVVLLARMSINRVIDTSVSQYRHQTYVALENHVSSYVDSYLRELHAHAKIPLLTQTVLQPDNHLADASDILGSLSLLGQDMPLFLMDFRGRILCTSRDEKPCPFTEQTWPERLMRGEQNTIVSLCSTKAGHFWLFAVPVLYNGMPEGILATLVPLDQIDAQKSFSKTNSGGAIRFIDQDTTLLTFGGPLANHPWLSLNLAAVPWDIQFQVDSGHVHAMFRQSLLEMIGCFVLVFLGATVASLFLGARLISTPLATLSWCTSRLAHGKQPPTVVAQHFAIRELNDLAQAFREMSRCIYDREKSLEEARDTLELRVQERTAELQVEIRERSAIQERLAQERALLRCLLDSVPDLIFYKDTRSIYLGCNKAFERYTGKTEADIVGRSDRDLFDASTAESYRNMDSRMLESGASRHNEEWIEYPDGTRVLLDTLKTPYYGPDGVTLGLIGISRDITEQKKAQEVLQQVNETLEEKIRERTSELQSLNTRLRTEVERRRKAEYQVRIQFELEKTLNQLAMILAEPVLPDLNALLQTMAQAMQADQVGTIQIPQKPHARPELSDKALAAVSREDIQLWPHGSISSLDPEILDRIRATPLTSSDVPRNKAVFSSPMDNGKILSVIPVSGGDESPKGLVFLTSLSGRRRRNDAKDGLLAIGHMVSLYWERKESQERLLKYQQELAALSQHLQSIRESDRKTISREIHDELGTTLTVLKFDLARVSKDLAPQQTKTRQRLQNAMKTIDATIHTVQRICTELRPGIIDDLGIEAALEWYADQFARRTALRCITDIPPQVGPLSQEMSINLFRIAQELLTNIARHARASEIHVDLVAVDGAVILMIRDNGCGIPDHCIAASDSFGLIGIRERVRHWNAVFEIAAMENGGTVAKVTIPVRGRDIL